ncbi:GTP pyrophosphokinase [Paenibacillus sp. MMS18-CY102]|uniref:GTP pyrophosphokinase n=1 Tax=Paenibacillus sp. MMS18-CY102 TaxID=2682849 RepID=UPI0013663D9F|nr:GTP pyrophosphokinase [Paenibacillus sp. MMS18-CY102]MWC26982.1 HD domain-containing protein [Paenibacillus sp. MMS18-CY102]
MSTLTKAILIATEMHDGQTDKGGNPYILHPLRLLTKATTEEERIVAVLHDVVEDTSYQLHDFITDGFSQRIIDALTALTKLDGESYDSFILRIRQNELATRVKILDITDNMDISRIAEPTEHDVKRIEKYQQALRILYR